MPVRAPNVSELRPILSDLIGKDCIPTADPGGTDPESIKDYLVAYVNDDDQTVMLAGGDSAFAHRSGAALALVPKVRADEAIASAALDDDLVENYREILNVLTRAINDQGGPHVRLVPESSLSSELPAVSGGQSFTVDVDGYGSGGLHFWTV